MEGNIDSAFNEVAAKTIRKYREKKGLSLEDVVNKMKDPVSRQSLYKYETNMARMKTNVFLDICKALNLESQDIYDEINKKIIIRNRILHSDSKVHNFHNLKELYELIEEEYQNQVKNGNKDDYKIENSYDLNDFLNQIHYDEIEDYVKKDKNHALLKYIESDDIVFEIYNENDDFVEIMQQHYELKNNIVSKIKNNKTNNGNDINFKQIVINFEADLLDAKKYKLMFFIKKIYSKDILLNELDNREYIIIKDKDTNKKIADKKLRLHLLETYLNIMINIDNIDKNMDKFLDETDYYNVIILENDNKQ